VHGIEAGDDRLEQRSGIMLHGTVTADGRLTGHLMEEVGHRAPGRVVDRRARGRGADVEGEDHRDTQGKIPPMAETWEVLTLRGLSAVDERAEEFTGTLVIHRVGSSEPVESVSVRVKRSVLAELHDTIARLLARSVGFRPKNS
jgi:hypothetical protein